MSGENRLSARSLRSSLFSMLDHMLPHTAYVDKLFLLARFVRAHNRWPIDPDRPDATFNDLIFSRLARADWNSLERFCIDKHYVKTFIRGFCPELRTASTVEVIKLSRMTAPDAIESTLLAHLGDRLVAKPTHGSGTILYMRKRPSRDEIRRFSTAAAHSYYRRSRESLYAGLERKVVLEEDLSEHDDAPIDYKFFCARGEVFFCQVDIDRFRCHKRALVTPAFEPIDIRYMHDVPPHALERPKKFGDMVTIARKLSSPFSFVRVDLYCVKNTVFFGELTFAPEGGAGSLSCESFGARVMAGIRQANARSGVSVVLTPALFEEPSRMSRKGTWDDSHCPMESKTQ